MRIISKFKDYYDNCGYKTGVDRSMVYVRRVEISDEEEKRGSYYHVELPRKHESRYSATFGSLWFCGKEYPIVIIEDTKSPVITKDWKVTNDPRLFHHERKTFLSGHGEGQKYIDVTLGSLFGYTERKWFNDNDRVADFMRVNDDINIKYNSPCVFIGRDQVIINPPLTELGFTKVMSPFQAFQEIHMYLMGALLEANIQEPLPLTETDEVRRHGMDKWSFRKKGKNSK